MRDSDIEFKVIKGTYYCPWCEEAAQFIKGKGLKVVITVLSRDRLIEETARARMHTVPIIYHGVHLIGGYDKLKNYMDSLDTAH